VPTIIQERAFRPVVHTRDHRPPHVHVKRRGEEVRINLLTLESMDPGPVPRGCIDAVRAHLAELLRAWERYHPER
jgi:hypothetical protein